MIIIIIYAGRNSRVCVQARYDVNVNFPGNYQTITWTNGDLSWKGSSGTILQDIFMNLSSNMCSETTLIKLLPDLPGVNELLSCSRTMFYQFLRFATDMVCLNRFHKSMALIFFDATKHQAKRHVETTESHSINDWIHHAVGKKQYQGTNIYQLDYWMFKAKCRITNTDNTVGHKRTPTHNEQSHYHRQILQRL